MKGLTVKQSKIKTSPSEVIAFPEIKTISSQNLERRCEKIVLKSHKREIAYGLAKKFMQIKLGGGYFIPLVQIGLKLFKNHF